MLESIGNLPEGEREAFDLVRIQGLTQAEAAQVLGVSAATVNRRLNRGLELLAEALSDLRPHQESGERSQVSGSESSLTPDSCLLTQEASATTDNPRLRQRLDELHDSDATPE